MWDYDLKTAFRIDSAEKKTNVRDIVATAYIQITITFYVSKK